MVFQRLASLLKIRRDEGRLVLLVAGLFLCLQAGQGLGDNAAAALFFLRYGVDFLPYMYMALGGLTFLTTLAYTTGLGRLGMARFFLGLLAVAAAVLLLERAAILTGLPAFYPIIWLTTSGLGMVLGTFAWNLAGAVCDARQAKRLFSLFASAGILGSVMGNAITGIAASSLGTDNLLVLHALLLAVALGLTRAITRVYLPPVGTLGRGTSLWSDLRGGFDFLRTSSLFRLVAFASVLFSVLFFSIAFPFSKVAAASFADEAGVAGFLGLFNSLTTAATFAVSLLVANRLYARLGIVNSVLLMPLTYIAGFFIFAASYNLPGAVAARFSQLVILGGVAGTAWNALFNVVPVAKRGQVLAFNNGVPAQVGVALSGVLLILGEQALTTSQIFLMGAVVALICAFLVFRMRSAYGQALIAALRAGRIEVFSSDETAFAGFQGDAAALRVVVEALGDPRPTTRRLAADILGRMQVASAKTALERSLSDVDPGVRAAAVGALAALRAGQAWLDLLDDPAAEVRAAALASIVEMNPTLESSLLARLEALLDDPAPAVRAGACVALFELGAAERSLSTLLTMLADGDADVRSLALQALGDLAGGLEPPQSAVFDVTPLITALGDPAAQVRRAACLALANLPGDQVLEALCGRLSDTHASVRHAAAAALQRAWPASRYRLIQLLDSAEDSVQEAALDAMAPNDPQTLDALLAYTHRETDRVRTLRQQLAGLPANGRALALLGETLRAECARREERLVKAVGLLGDPRTMDLIRKSLKDRRPGPRAAALEALETLGNKQLTQQIIALLEEEPEGGASPPPPGAPGSTGALPILEALLNADPPWIRSLAARAVQEARLAALSPHLRHLLSDENSLVREAAYQALVDFGEERPMDTLPTISIMERILLLREVPIFTVVSPEDLEQIARLAAERWYPPGAWICRQGEEGDALYLLVEGRVEVVAETEGKARLIANRGAGEFVGEMAILDAAPRSASVRAQQEVRVLVIEAEVFKVILQDRPDVALAVLRAMSRRLREMTDTLS